MSGTFPAIAPEYIMKTHSRHTASNGRAFATVVETTSRRIAIHLAINQNPRYPTTYALTIGQARAVAQVLGAALADRGNTHAGSNFPRHVAEEGRAKAQLKHDFAGGMIWLTIRLGSDRFLNLPLPVRDAEAVFSCASAAVHAALELARSFDPEGAR